MDLHLNDAERDLLDEILKERHMVLQVEKEHSHNQEFRHILQQRETMLEDIIERLDAAELAAD